MSDSTQDPGERRNNRDDERRGGRSGQGSRSGSGRSSAGQDGRRSYGSRDDRGDRRSYGSRDDRGGERKYGSRDDRGGQRSYGSRDDRGGDRKYGSRDDRGDERKYTSRDDRGGQRSYGSRDDRGGERKYTSRDDRGGQRSYGSRDDRGGERKYGSRDDRGGQRSYGSRDDRGGERKYTPRGTGERRYGSRDDRGGRDERRSDRPGGSREHRSHGRVAGRPAQRSSDRERAPRQAGHGAAELSIRPRHDDPPIAERITPRDLDPAARAELKTLSKENAEWVARHLVAASEALEDDPALAHRHALSASRRAGRVAVVRETLAITAYATGDFALALRELRTYRRISGNDDQIALMVDSERGVGRPDRALELGRSVDRSTLPAAVQAALAIAMSGARLDLEQPELALGELEVPQLDPDRAFSYSPALFSAYAEVLDELGRSADAARWRALSDRAEAALEGARPDFIEVFELEVEEEPVAIDDPAETDGSADTDADTTEPEPEPEPEVDAEGDPADAIEPEVAAVLAETAHLDGEQDAGRGADRG
ncbi:hypothetical protein GCM10017608_17790 [Agromyces luteolus]|uniref:hypothetical protein n=1 Tax=Agromyces luteolus TaxID=88373 RepID=UPI00197A7148|nr:hypothetical protein [Agromyces luteolus]GLK27845.1 hypothetical protein GCM10017608_17790 [Agromyces luteolus]